VASTSSISRRRFYARARLRCRVPPNHPSGIHAGLHAVHVRLHTASQSTGWTCPGASRTCTEAPPPCAPLPELIDLIWNRQINPGKVFDLELPLEEAAAGYRAMDQREANNLLGSKSQGRMRSQILGCLLGA
jgi:hypothetical protein